jgi:uncharacterized membrane protein
MRRLPVLHQFKARAQWLVLALASIYAAWFSLYTCLEHESFRTAAFDLGTFDQGIWLAGHGSDHFVTVRGLPLLGDHTRFISFALAPLYWIWDDVRALLALQSVAIAAGAWFLFQICLHELPGRPWLACTLSATYLLHPAVQNLNLDHAHPDAFAATFILSSLYFLRTRQLVAFWVAAALAVSCKEDIPLVFATLGAVMTIRRQRRRLGTVLVIVSLAYFALCLTVILPYFNEYGFFRYGEHGNLVGLWFRGSDPAWILERLLSTDRIDYLWRIGAPHLYLFLLSPLAALPALPPLAANLLSDTRHMRDLQFHYHFSIVPFFFVGTIATLARFEGIRQRSAGSRALRRSLTLAASVASPALLLAAVAAQISWSRVPLTQPNALVDNWRSVRSDGDLAKIRSALKRIPKSAPVSAHYLLVPHLTHRRSVYMFPNPFETHKWGVHGERSHDPRSVRYIVLLSRLSTPAYEAIVSELLTSGDFVPIVEDDVVALYRRRREASDPR